MIRQDISLTPAINDVLRNLDTIGVVTPQPGKVRAYLTQHPDLLDVIALAARAARERLGVNTQLSLELYQDPEASDCYPTLYVRRLEYDVGIFALIDEIGSAYERDLVGKSGWFLVTTDLRPPT